MTAVVFIDTSVLCELLEVPGKSEPSQSAQVQAELSVGSRAGERFVVPITTVIETGNHIAQAPYGRVEAARRLVRFLRMAIAGEAPWLLLTTTLGHEFVSALCAGDSTGKPLEVLAAEKVGAGDVALLVERDQFLATIAYSSARVWTLDVALRAYAQAAS
jgi:hypothetical protein